ncbi:hypothetical protein NQZ79_g4056 [Umbelopsis isabellina]|nr:hypothetical protein NQZ79_g4056 [Umbelopsis isabellina]
MIPTPDLSHLSTSDYRNIYEPSEDTFLLLDALEADEKQLKELNPSVCLEIGSGSGCVTTFLGCLLKPNQPYLITTDINPKAAVATVMTGKKNGVSIDTVQTSLVTNLLPRLRNAVDVLCFNPPYAVTPSEEIGGQGIEASWAGGIDGREVIDTMLPFVKAIYLLLAATTIKLSTAISLDDAVSKLHLALGDTVGKEYHHAHQISDIPHVEDIKHWTASVCNKALNEKEQAMSVNSFKGSDTLSSLAQLFRKAKGIPAGQVGTEQAGTNSDEVAWTKKCKEKGALAILDSVYEASLGVEDFNSTQTVDEHYNMTPMRKTVTVPLIQAAVYGSSMVEFTAHSAGVSSTWLPVCDTDQGYVNAADRLIFYNTLAAGLQALSPDLYKEYAKEGPQDDAEERVIKHISRLSIQLHMLQSIAKVAHLDPNDAAVKTMIYLCTLGDSATTSLSQTAKQIGEAVGSKVPNVIPHKVLDSVNRKVALELIARSTQEDSNAVVKVGQKIPGVRNIFDFVVDASSTWGIGKVAKVAFCPLPGQTAKVVEHPKHEL